MAKKKIINIANEDILPITDVSCIQGLIDNGKIKDDLLPASSGSGTQVEVNSVNVSTLSFDSNPQTQLDKHTTDIKTINETIDGINDIQDLSLTREFTSSIVANGAVVGSICEVERINGKSEVVEGVFKHLEFSKLESTGVNLFDISTAKNEIWNGTTSVGNIIVDGDKLSSNSGSSGISMGGVKINVVPNTDYYFKFKASGGTYRVGVYQITDGFDILWVNSSVNEVEKSFNSGENTQLHIGFGTDYGSSDTIIFSDIIISLNDIEYVPYEVLDTINYGDIELKQYDYIYGVKKYSQSESFICDGSETDWIMQVYNNTFNYFYRTSAPIENRNSNTTFITSNSKYEVTTGNANNTTFMSSYAGQERILFFDSSFSSLDEWKTYLSTNPITIVYQTSTITETPLDIYPYLNIKQNGNLTFNSNLSVPNTIIYPLNTKSEVARLSSLVGKLDNEIIELKSKEVDLSEYVQKEEGKGLSTNDYNNSSKNIVDNVTTNLSSKVDKISGKGLSTNDFTNEYVSKIATNTSDIKSLEARVDALGFEEFEIENLSPSTILISYTYLENTALTKIGNRVTGYLSVNANGFAQTPSGTKIFKIPSKFIPKDKIIRGYISGSSVTLNIADDGTYTTTKLLSVSSGYATVISSYVWWEIDI